MHAPRTFDDWLRRPTRSLEMSLKLGIIHHSPKVLFSLPEIHNDDRAIGCCADMRDSVWLIAGYGVRKLSVVRCQQGIRIAFPFEDCEH